MKDANILLALSIINGTALLIGVCTYLGCKWIDKMMTVPPPFDPKKPLVRKLPTLSHRETVKACSGVGKPK